MYICVCIHTNTCIYTCIYMYIYTYICMYTYKIFIDKYKYIHIYKNTYTYIYIYIHSFYQEIYLLWFFWFFLKFMAVLGLCFCVRAFSSLDKWGPLLITVRGPLTIVASPVVEHRLQTRKLSNCGSRAQLLLGMWDPPRPGLEPMSPALAGRFSTTAPPGKPQEIYLNQKSCTVTYSQTFAPIITISQSFSTLSLEFVPRSLRYCPLEAFAPWYNSILSK